jgi:hypothetical protein
MELNSGGARSFGPHDIASPRLAGDARRLAGRLLAQEYLPLAAWLLAWATLTAQLGLTYAALLIAANGFFQATRSLALLQSYDALSGRAACSEPLDGKDRWLAIRTDGAGLLTCLALLALLNRGLDGAGLIEVASMVTIMAVGLPARTPCALLVAGRHITASWRIGSGVTLLAGAMLILFLDLGWQLAALLLGLREWGGLIATLLLGGRRSTELGTALGALEFPEIASRTSMAARRRLVYRTGKAALSALGPVGSVIARTGRGGGVDARIARWLPFNLVSISLLAILCTGGTVALIVVRPEPAVALVASALARVGAAALSVLIWWRWNGPEDQFMGWQEE